MKMKMEEICGLEWKMNATLDERRLWAKVYNLSDLFEDMLFQPGTCTAPLISVQEEIEPGKEVDSRMPLPGPLESFEYIFFRFKVFQVGELENKETLGYFHGEEQELAVRADQLVSDSVILHELIHLHEFVLLDERVPLNYRDMYIWALYQQVRKRIPDLDTLIEEHAHSLTQTVLCEAGGFHGILFLLKSFELDMRMGYKLGTVFGYGRTDEFKDYSYLPEGSD